MQYERTKKCLPTSGKTRKKLQITNRSETINAEIKIIFGTVNTKWAYTVELRSVEGIYYTNKQITWLARRKRPTDCSNTVQYELN